MEFLPQAQTRVQTNHVPSPDESSPPSENFFFIFDSIAEKSRLSLQSDKMPSSTALTSKVTTGSPYQLDTPQVCHNRHQKIPRTY
jgi:hypothetical protein